MKKMIRTLAALLLCGISLAPRAETEYRFGVVPQFEARHLASIWVPILEELSRRTGLHLVMAGSPRIPDFERAFQQGRFDFAYMNPYHSLTAAETQGYQPLVRDGGRSLYGILVVPRESPIQSVAELEGQTLAFPAPNALGASLLMRAELATLHKLTIEPDYVKTHSSVYTSVLLGRAAAGGGVMGTLKRQKPQVQQALRVLYKTREMPPHPVVAHPRVPAEHRDAVRHALLEMAAGEEGAALLAKVPIKRLIAATVDDYRPLKEWGLERFYVANP